MILLSSILSEQRIVSDVDLGSKKKLLEHASQLFSNDLNINSKALFSAFFEREQLSSTGIGNGFALPHARISGISSAYCSLIKLPTAIEFEAIDNQNVDLICSLIVPEEATQDHLEILASIAKLFSDETTCQAIRVAPNSDAILQIIQQQEAQS